MFNWTRRHNGEHMVTIKVTHHLSLLDMAYVLAVYAINEHDGENPPSPLSRTKGEALFRDHISELGNGEPWHVWESHEKHASYWGDGSGRPARVWAYEHMKRHYPATALTEVEQWALKNDDDAGE